MGEECTGTLTVLGAKLSESVQMYLRLGFLCLKSLDCSLILLITTGASSVSEHVPSVRISLPIFQMVKL